MGQGDMSPIYLRRGDIHGNVPHILEMMSFRMLTRVPVCCILTQNCVVLQSFSLSRPDPLPGLHPGTPLRDFRPSDPQYPPNNPVRSTPLLKIVSTNLRIT